jgi:hypothetical protein
MSISRKDIAKIVTLSENDCVDNNYEEEKVTFFATGRAKSHRAETR